MIAVLVRAKFLALKQYKRSEREKERNKKWREETQIEKGNLIQEVGMREEVGCIRDTAPYQKT